MLYLLNGWLLVTAVLGVLLTAVIATQAAFRWGRGRVVPPGARGPGRWLGPASEGFGS